MAMKRLKAKTIKAFTVAQGETILLDRIEPWTDDGRAKCLRGINRPAGERVISVRITQIDQ
jgi:hypothetical protein